MSDSFVILYFSMCFCKMRYISRQIRYALDYGRSLALKEDKKGAFTFACGMDMLRGKLIVQ